MITADEVNNWIKRYVHAWESAEPAEIEALFAADAEYHEWPYETHWYGHDEITAGWLSRQPWQAGGWAFDWRILMITGDTAAIQGTGVYRELGTFDNLWVITFDDSGACGTFRMWNNEAGS